MLVVKYPLRMAGSFRRYSDRNVGSASRNWVSAVALLDRYGPRPEVLAARYCDSTETFAERKLPRTAGFCWRYDWTAETFPVLRPADAAALLWRNSLSALTSLPTMKAASPAVSEAAYALMFTELLVMNWLMIAGFCCANPWSAVGFEAR